jgi:hypothetical protein
LDDILGVIFITRKPARKVKGSIQVRQNGFFKVLDSTLAYRIVRRFIPGFL